MESAQPKKNVRFAESLWGDFKVADVLRRRHKTLSSMCAFFRAKAQLDAQYSTKLEKLVRNSGLASCEIANGPLHASAERLKTLMRGLAEQHKQVARELQQAAKPLAELHSKVTHAAARVSQRWAHANKDMHRSVQRLIHSRSQRSDAWAHMSNLDFKRQRLPSRSGRSTPPPTGSTPSERGPSTPPPPPPEASKSRRGSQASNSNDGAVPVPHKNRLGGWVKTRFGGRPSQWKKKFNAADEAYLQSVKACREARRRYDPAVSTYLTALQELESSRLVGLWQALQECVLAHRAKSERERTLVMDLSPKIAQNAAQDEMKLFAFKHGSGLRPPPLPVYETPGTVTPGRPAGPEALDVHEDSSTGDWVDLGQKGGEETTTQHTDTSMFPLDALYSKTGEKRGEGDSGRGGAPTPSQRNRRVSTAAERKAGDFFSSVLARVVDGSGFVLEDDDLSAARELFAASEARMKFAMILNQRRGHHDNIYTKQVLEELARLVRCCLDACQRDGSAQDAQMLLILSQTFFYFDSGTTDQEPEASRIFLQVLIRDHPIWRGVRFWQQAVHEAFQKELQRCPKALLIHRWCTDSEQLEALAMQHKILFGILASFCTNMVQFGVDRRHIIALIDSTCGLYKVGQRQIETLVKLVSAPMSSIERRTSIVTPGVEGSEELKQPTPSPAVAVCADADTPPDVRKSQRQIALPTTPPPSPPPSPPRRATETLAAADPEQRYLAILSEQ